MPVEHLKSSPLEPDVWQGDVVLVPERIVPAGTRAVHPHVWVWRSRKTGSFHFGEPKLGDAIGVEHSLNALAGLAREIGYRPDHIEVSDDELADFLKEQLGPIGTEVALVERLELIDEVRRHMPEITVPLDQTCLLNEPDVTLAHVRDFAEAAAVFGRARPWLHLTDEDLIQVHSDAPDEGLSHCAVLGHAGQEYGLAFFKDPREFKNMRQAPGPELALERGSWSLTFGTIDELSARDRDLWQRHELPVAGDDAYPTFLRYSRTSLDNADAGILTYVAGLLRALAATTEDELDRGHWMKSVATTAGDAQVELSIPTLLAPPEPTERDEIEDRRLQERAPRSGEPTTPLDRAQDLVDQALAVRGRRRVKLAREALRLSSESADAYVILAEEMPDLEQCADLYRRGMEAGASALGAEAFENDAGRFWAILETRPYMRARLGYAECLYQLGDTDQCVEHLRELLRLNPADNMGIRYALIPRLLELERYDEARAALDDQADDDGATMAYARALLAFMKEGDSESARKLRRAATRANPHVLELLRGATPMPAEFPEGYTPGDKSEALVCLVEMSGVFENNADAVAWLMLEPEGEAHRQS